MKLIAHRGNTCGRNIDLENRPDYILEALANGFDVEVDIWLINNKTYTGHDEPQYIVTEEFILNKRLWLHAKNFDMFNYRTYKSLNIFWHESDSYVLVRNGFIWTQNIEAANGGNTIILMDVDGTLLKKLTSFPPDIYAYCTDDLREAKAKLEDLALRK
jgi:hypothetical protein